jgi:hypothetical protein
MAIKIEESVHRKLNRLIDKLHDKKYFGYKSAAVKYVLAIYDFIDSIPNQQVYLVKVLKEGEFFCKFSPDKHTTYYIVLKVIGGGYLIRDIFNNHGKEYDDFFKH